MAQVRKPKDKQYIVTEDFTADINNKKLVGKRGDVVKLTITEYNVLRRFVVAI